MAGTSAAGHSSQFPGKGLSLPSGEEWACREARAAFQEKEKTACRRSAPELRCGRECRPNLGQLPERLVAPLIAPLDQRGGRMLIPGEAAHHNEMIAPTVTE